MNVNSFNTAKYVKLDTLADGKNKPKQTQFSQRDTQYAIRDTPSRADLSYFVRPAEPLSVIYGLPAAQRSSYKA